MDENNFDIIIGKWECHMINGELEINDCSYEEQHDDPTYDFIRELWRLKRASGEA